MPVDEDGGGDEGGDEEDDPRRLLLRRPRVRHVLEPVQRRLLFSEREREKKEIERSSGFVGWSVKEIRTVKRTKKGGGQKGRVTHDRPSATFSWKQPQTGHKRRIAVK